MFGFKLLTEREIEELKRKAHSNIDLEEKYLQLKKRVIELEDNFEKTNKITVRVEKTLVVAKLTKMEMIIVMAAIDSLMKNPKTNHDDMKYYFELYAKIQGFVKDMEEERKV